MILGNIADIGAFRQNLEENCIPDGIERMSVRDYDDFLAKRRVLMAKLIERYYKNL